MGSIKSPYREWGMQAHARPRNKRYNQPSGYWVDSKDMKRMGHKWDVGELAKDCVLCRLCGRPKFAVEFAKCENR